MSTEIRTRFAPSPTGYLHIGGVRTALYNYLFAKKHKGKFILRIEDTDVERSKDEYTLAISEGMKWLGLNWDGGPYYQSERLDLYRQELKSLEKSGRAYKCFCTSEQLKEEREKAKQEGIPAGYDGKCRKLPEGEVKKLQDAGDKYTWRFKTPDTGRLSFKDAVKGTIEFDLATIGDFVIVRSDGMPTYNFTCVVDDALLKISHVIRGDDHISNTPKQILIYNALEKEPPQFAHLPQVHGKDGKRLSKRTGAVSLAEYIEMGYLSEAMLNYLALLGWSTEDSQQLFSMAELIEKFSLDRVSASAGIFDTDKLDWINGKCLRALTAREIASLASKWLKEKKLIESSDKISDKIIKAIEMEKEKISLLSDVPEKIDFMLSDNIIYDEKAVQKRLKKAGAGKILLGILEVIQNVDSFTAENLENAIRKLTEEKNISAGKIFHPLRVAVSGRMTGPGLFELIEFIGKEKTVERIKYAAEELAENE